jgi:predicted nucleic acid-binding Zn ribbon protein
MPVYTYDILNADQQPIGRVELIQSMAAPPLDRHPSTGERIKRVITAPNIVTRYSDRQMRKPLSNENIERHGFSKYEKVGTGQYVKTAGKQGPSTLD